MTECNVCERSCPPPLVESGGRMVKNPNGFSRKHWSPKPLEDSQLKKELRVEEFFGIISENQEARAKRSPQQQLKLIAGRRGESKKETARLLAQIETKKAKKGKKGKK